MSAGVSGGDTILEIDGIDVFYGASPIRCSAATGLARARR